MANKECNKWYWTTKINENTEILFRKFNWNIINYQIQKVYFVNKQSINSYVFNSRDVLYFICSESVHNIDNFYFKLTLMTRQKQHPKFTTSKPTKNIFTIQLIKPFSLFQNINAIGYNTYITTEVTIDDSEDKYCDRKKIK